MATLTGYTLIGSREDLTNKLILLGDDTSTILSNIKQDTNATSRTHEWQDYSLPAAADTAQVEGFTPSPSAVVRVRRSNQVQINSRSWSVADSVLAGRDIAGVASEIEFQAGAYLNVLHQDIEKALVTQLTAVTGDGSTPAKARGIFGSITTNVAIPAATTSVIVEADVLGLIKKVFDATGSRFENMLMFAPSVDAQRIMNFTGTSSNGKTIFVTEKTKVHNRYVQIIMTNFGNVTIIPCTSLAGIGKIAVMNMDTWALAWKERVVMKPLARVKDATEGYYKCEWTLEHLRETANAILTGCATA